MVFFYFKGSRNPNRFITVYGSWLYTVCIGPFRVRHMPRSNEYIFHCWSFDKQGNWVHKLSSCSFFSCGYYQKELSPNNNRIVEMSVHSRKWTFRKNWTAFVDKILISKKSLNFLWKSFYTKTCEQKTG